MAVIQTLGPTYGLVASGTMECRDGEARLSGLFVFAIFATLLVATIALRLAIWLPISAIKSAL